MAVEVGEVDVTARPAPDASPRDERAASQGSPPSSQLPLEIERALALELTRDLRLRAD